MTFLKIDFFKKYVIEKKLILGAVLLIIIVGFVLFYKFWLDKLDEDEIVVPAPLPVVGPLIDIPASGFFDHINELPNGSGTTKIYESPEPLSPVISPEKVEALEKIVPADTFIEHKTELPEKIEVGVFPPIPEEPVVPKIPADIFIEHTEDFPNFPFGL